MALALAAVGSKAAWARDDVPSHSTIAGTVETVKDVSSPQLGNRRDLLVYLPPSYKTGARRYPVLYMQDGQNVFDEATAFVHREWKADEAAEALAAKGQELIIVAIPHTEQNPAGPGRLSEYSPFRVPPVSTGRGAQYADFVALTVKPLVDARYRTLGRAEHTGVLGSSMGGLISLYIALRYPDVFGFAGVLSPSLFFADYAIVPWVKAHPASRPVRIYMDVGTLESAVSQSEDAVGKTRELADLLRSQGMDVTFVVAGSARHDEDAWARRLPGVLELFLKGRGEGRPSKRNGP